MDSPPARSVDEALQRNAMTRRLHRRSLVAGQITVPAVPGMIDEYVSMCETLFAAVGRPFTAEQLGEVRAVLAGQLAEAYAHSPRSNIVISLDAPFGTILNYHVKPEWWSVETAYENWISTREPPLFGTEPDARVWTLANETADPATHPVLDIGGGTGRNTLALARRGHPVDVVEMTPKFADMIRADADRESLKVRVIQRDIFTTDDDLRRDYRMIVLSEVVSDFRTSQQLSALFELATQCLASGGRLVFNVFVSKPGYTPNDAVRELGQQCYTTIFTPSEVSAAASGSPLQLISDDSVYEYEKSHLPEGTWPPTSWYADWVSGLDVFDLRREDCPIEMRWLVYQKPTW
jgi:SAM-dependent methyltransferase